MSDVAHASTRAIYGRLVAFARPYTGRLVIGVLAGMVGGASIFGFLNASPALIRPFDHAPATGAAAAAAASPVIGLAQLQALADRLHVPLTDAAGRITWQTMLLTLLLMPLLMFVNAGANYVSAYSMRWVGTRVVRDLRDALFAHLQHQSLSYFGKCDIGRLISGCTNDAAVVENTISSTVSDAVQAPIIIIATLSFVALYAHQQHIAGILGFSVLFFLCVVPVVLLGRYVKRYSRRALGRIADLVSRMHENFTGVRVVKAFDMEEAEIERFAVMNANYFQTMVKALKAELMMNPLMLAVAVVLTCAFAIMCYAHGVLLSQILPIGAAAVWAYRPIKQLAKINANIQRGAAALDRIYRILDADTQLPEAPNAVPVTAFEDRIRFDHVSFRYDVADRPVLADIDLDVPKGTVVALVGETGSGKTTMANLLARFYDPTEGRVLLDGVDLRQIQVSSLRRLVGVVTQDTILFNDTIAANIAYGSPNADRAAIVEAAKQANAHNFIIAETEGYERVVGEKGFLLSGGEKQRIALARAILKNPPILILDEATSALDTVTEHLVQEAIARLMQHRTVFAIAHRLSTVRNANQIVVVDKGRIIERGTHSELYEAGGRYRKLCDMQVLGE